MIPGERLLRLVLNQLQRSGDAQRRIRLTGLEQI
jgi:hypothetical protein